MRTSLTKERGSTEGNSWLTLDPFLRSRSYQQLANRAGHADPSSPQSRFFGTLRPWALEQRCQCYCRVVKVCSRSAWTNRAVILRVAAQPRNSTLGCAAWAWKPENADPKDQTKVWILQMMVSRSTCVMCLRTPVYRSLRRRSEPILGATIENLSQKLSCASHKLEPWISEASSLDFRHEPYDHLGGRTGHAGVAAAKSIGIQGGHDATVKEFN